jgi:hypothetical protein
MLGARIGLADALHRISPLDRARPHHIMMGAAGRFAAPDVP